MRKAIVMIDTKNKQSGFTLIEMSISLIIIGVLLSMGFALYQPYIDKKKVRITNERLDNAYAALEEYKNDVGFYPCVAPLSAGRADGNYGEQTDCSITAVAEGDCEASGEYCVRQSNRTVSIGDRRVRLGALPFRQLNLSERGSYDGYKSKIYYAVTEEMARDTASYVPGQGGIEVVDSRGEFITDPNAPAIPFVLFSVGENRVGGYNLNGAMVNDCDAPYAGDDLRNCGEILEAVFINRNKVDSGLANEMDDFFVFNKSTLEAIPEGWRVGSPASGENATDTMADLPVKIGDFSEEPRELLDIDGGDNDLRVEHIALAEASVCDYDTAGNVVGDCFDTADLVRTCPAGEYVTGIGPDTTLPLTEPNPNVKIICERVQFSCLSGEMIIGVNNDGTAQCAPIPPPLVGPSASDTVIPVCGELQNFPRACDAPSTLQYNEVQRRDCDSNTWVYVSDNKTSACCDLSPTPPPLDSLTGRTWDACGAFGIGSVDRPRSLDIANCNYVTNEIPNCTCDADILMEAPVIKADYNSNLHYVTACGQRNFTSPMIGGRCRTRVPSGNYTFEGDYEPADHFWTKDTGTPTTLEFEPGGGFTISDGDSCSTYGATSGCASSNSVTVDGKHQLYTGCKCIKKPKPGGEDRCRDVI